MVGSSTSIPMDRSTEREQMVAQLDARAIINDPRLEEAMLEVPRHLFIPTEIQAAAYEDRPLPVGGGQTTSAPHMVAIMTMALQLQPGMRVLEIGCGGGYHCAILAKMVGETGQVYGLDMREDLVELARARFDEIGVSAKLLVQDGFEGLPEFAPFDAILITCAIPRVPAQLFEQLADGGHLLAPIGITRCDLTLHHKHDGKVRKESMGDCIFVNAQGQLGG